MKYRVFLISDSTGITVSTLAQSALAQFEHIEFMLENHHYIDSKEKAYDLVKKINDSMDSHNGVPIVFCTIVIDEILVIIKQCNARLFDFSELFIKPLEQIVGTHATHVMGRAHSMHDQAGYQRRIDALNYSLNTDDGAHLKQYDKADLILIGVSRSSKTPTSLYLAMHHSLKVANYPMTEEDLSSYDLPEILQKHRHKLFGLTIAADRLAAIRHERKPGSRYATIKQCQTELSAVKRLFKHYAIPYLDATTLSIEELATKILTLYRDVNKR
ncbi:MAG: pyruvate, water dikinase regulatory protein [Francisellaceae bacterium]